MTSKNDVFITSLIFITSKNKNYFRDSVSPVGM